MGMASNNIAPENPIATPCGPQKSPMEYPAIAVGAMRHAMARLLVVLPVANSIQDNGLMRAKTSIVGVSSLKMLAASAHFGPRNTRTISSANRAHAAVTGAMMARKTP